MSIRKICVINAKYCMNTAINLFRREVNKFVVMHSSTFVSDNDNSKKSAGRSILKNRATHNYLLFRDFMK